ncbi:MAG: hypothetical protein MSH49_01655 [[Eubacterium] saphenum]|nr:hypothetical protein [[Eubacterium] saphenum]
MPTFSFSRTFGFDYNMLSADFWQYFVNSPRFAGIYERLCGQFWGFCEALAISAASSHRNRAGEATPEA